MFQFQHQGSVSASDFQQCMNHRDPCTQAVNPQNNLICWKEINAHRGIEIAPTGFYSLNALKLPQKSSFHYVQ